MLTGHPRPAARPPRALRPWQSPRARSGGPRPQDDPPQRSGRGTAPTGFPPRSQLRNGRRQINGDSRGQLKPGVSKLWLVTELPGNPLRGSAHIVTSTIAKTTTIWPQSILVADMMTKGQASLAPRASAASRRAYERRLQATIRSDAGSMPSMVCYRRQLGKHLRFGSISHFDPQRPSGPRYPLHRNHARSSYSYQMSG